MLNGIFQSDLTRKLDVISLPSKLRAQIEGQRSRLAAIETKDGRGRQAIQESFIAGYRAIAWSAAALAVASSVCAVALITTERRPERETHSVSGSG
jgi:hypothetical protein